MTDRRHQILRAAITLFLSEGVSVSTAKIAKAAGVSNGTLFNTFATKQELIDAIYVSTKTSMYSALSYSPGEPFDKRSLRAFWHDYRTWDRQNPEDRRVSHLIFGARLASVHATTKTDALFADFGTALSAALEEGRVVGPSIGFVGQLIFNHLDLVIAQDLSGDDEDLAFDMLCNTIGLNV